MKTQELQLTNSYRNKPTSYNSTQIMIWFFLGIVTMLFAGFTSAYIIRSSADDWKQIQIPKILGLNSIVLIISSITFELAKKIYKQSQTKLGELFIFSTLGCGILFILGQFLIWQKLHSQGIYISTNSHSSFFYILTGLHILHFLGGITWLSIISIKIIKNPLLFNHSNIISNCSTYWHYFTGLWIYIMYLLFVFKL